MFRLIAAEESIIFFSLSHCVLSFSILSSKSAIFLIILSKETIDKFYAMVKPVNANNRWYDKDPVISKTVEILRIVPPEAQKICAQNFIRTLKEMGIEYVSPNGTESGK